MKKTITKEITICDACGKESFVAKCLGCGVEHCWDCREKLGVLYPHSVYFSGTGDGYFCNKCDMHPPKNVQTLHQAYKNIRILREASKAWSKKFNIDCKNAEANINKLSKS